MSAVNQQLFFSAVAAAQMLSFLSVINILAVMTVTPVFVHTEISLDDQYYSLWVLN